MENITGITITRGKVDVVDSLPGWNNIKKHIELEDCPLDVVYFEFDGVSYEILVDDEGLLKSDRYQSGLIKYEPNEYFDGITPLFGNLFIARYDVEKRTDASLTAEDIVKLSKHIAINALDNAQPVFIFKYPEE